jgi:transaldolase
MEQQTRLTVRPKTQILLDSGDPHETETVKHLLGFIDGQTTNPSLIAKNPDIARLVKSGQRLTERQELDAYCTIVSKISPLVGGAGVSIEVLADQTTSAEQMLEQGREMFSWIPNAYVKYPCTTEGLKAAELSVRRGIRVNITLCFSQEQAAAVYAATKGTTEPAYVSPFIGRLDDIGQHGLDLVRNIKRMYEGGDGHVRVLAASLRSIAHLLSCFSMDADLATVPLSVLQKWADAGFPYSGEAFAEKATGARIEYRDISLDRPWQSFDIAHSLTASGVEKFAADYRAILQGTAR